MTAQNQGKTEIILRILSMVDPTDPPLQFQHSWIDVLALPARAMAPGRAWD
jgi:hypothetical protein